MNLFLKGSKEFLYVGFPSEVNGDGRSQWIVVISVLIPVAL
jgi:hypothetical protein